MTESAREVAVEAVLRAWRKAGWRAVTPGSRLSAEMAVDAITSALSDRDAEIARLATIIDGAKDALESDDEAGAYLMLKSARASL